jgi:hypothetical protein
MKTHYQVRATAKEHPGEHIVFPAITEHAVKEDTFSVRSMPWIYNED